MQHDHHHCCTNINIKRCLVCLIALVSDPLLCKCPLLVADEQ